MNIEEVALKYADSRPGLELVNYVEVGLPFWRLPLLCTVIERKPLPPIEEFTLKTVAAGLQSADEIAGFLGLDDRLSVAVIADLLSSGSLRTVAAGQYSVTEHGRLLLESCEEMRAQQEHIVAFYDGLTHETHFLTDTDFLEPRQLREFEIREWPAFPADPPGVEEIDLHGIRKAWEAKDLHKKRGKEIISVDYIEKKGRKRRYLEAVALVFQSTDPAERPQVAFAVDGRLSESHEEAFGIASGERKHNLLSSLKLSSEATVRPLLKGLVEAAKTPDVLEAVAEAEKARADLLAVERKTTALGETGGHTSELLAQIEELRLRLEEAETRRDNFTARRVPVQEHPRLLKQALEEANERVMIISPWIKAAVIDMDFLELMKRTLGRGVEVTIGYGIGGPDGDGDPIAIKTLGSLTKYGKLQLVRIGNTHAKVLVKDHDWVVVTSFNWLSFRGDPRRPIRDERGFYCSDPEQVQGVFDEYARMIEKDKS